MHIERDVELAGLDGTPHAKVHDAVVAHEPSQRHIDALQRRGAQCRGQAARVGCALIGLGKLVLHQFSQLPRRGFAVAHMVVQRQLVQRAVLLENTVKSAQHIAHVLCKKCAVDVDVGQLVVSLVHNIVVGLILHDGEHLLAVIANHFAVAPRDGCAQYRHQFNVLQAVEPARKLHRVVGNEIGGVYSASFAIEKFFEIRKFVFVEHCH